MTEALQQLMPQIERLCPADRDELLEKLLILKEPEDDPAEIEAAWEAEIARRTEEIRNGKAKGRPAEQVFADLDATLHRRLEEIQNGREKGVSEKEFLAQLRKESP